MSIFEFIILVFTIPLASQLLSTIFPTGRFALLILLPIFILQNILSVEMLKGLFQTTILSNLPILEYLKLLFFDLGASLLGTEYLQDNSIVILLSLTVFSPSFNSESSGIDSSEKKETYFIPVVYYDDANTDKLRILSDNKGRAGIYQWTHKESGKIYIGSAFDLSKRIYNYYNKSYISSISNSVIYKALLNHDYSAFSFAILEFVEVKDLPNDKVKQMILEREQYYLDKLSLLPSTETYNILKIAGSRLGSKHSEETLEKISGKNSHMYGKTGESHPFFGKKHTEESLTKNRLSNIGKIKHTPESKEKIGLAKTKLVYVYNSDNLNLFKTFNSCKDTAEYFNCTQRTISNYLNKDKIYSNKWILSSTRLGD